MPKPTTHAYEGITTQTGLGEGGSQGRSGVTLAVRLEIDWHCTELHHHHQQLLAVGSVRHPIPGCAAWGSLHGLTLWTHTVDSHCVLGGGSVMLILPIIASPSFTSPPLFWFMKGRLETV